MINDIEKNDQLPSALTRIVLVVIILTTIGMGLMAYLVCKDLDKQTIQEYGVSAIAEEGHCDDGTVRVVSAKVYERQGNIITLEDSTGNLWEVEDVAIADSASVLLWLADNHTTNDVTDDVIVEVYTNTNTK